MGKIKKSVRYATDFEKMTRKKTEKKEDLRVLRTKSAIRAAFKELVCELPYEKCTVKAISERAGINRNTFYLHYDSVDDVLREIQAEHSAQYIEKIKNLSYTENLSELVRSFFEYIEAQDEFFKRVTCDSRFDYIREGMQKKVSAHTHGQTAALHEKSEAVQNIVRAYATTVLILYRQWVFDGCKIPLEEMISIATALLENGMSGFKKMSC